MLRLNTLACSQAGALDHDVSLYAELAHLKPRLVYASRLGSGSEDIHFAREVIRGDDSHDLLEEAIVPWSGALERKQRGLAKENLLLCRIHQIELRLPLHELLPRGVTPY